MTKTWIGLLTAFIGISATPVLAETQTVVHVPELIIAPSGITDQEQAQIVLTGYYPNSCYGNGPIEKIIDRERREIFLRPYANVSSDGVCLFSLIPYAQVVNLGKLQAGDYRVVVEDQQKLYSQTTVLTVQRATSQDEEYPIIENAKLLRDRKTDSLKVEMAGYFSDTCTRLSDVRLHYGANNTIEVRPTITRKDGLLCAEVASPFRTSVELTPPFRGETIVRVKSMGGQTFTLVTRL